MKFKDGHWVLVRCLLYFGISFLPELVGIFTESAKYEYWPSGVRIFTAILSGVLAGLISCRAYLDGSFQQWKEKASAAESEKTP